MNQGQVFVKKRLPHCVPESQRCDLHPQCGDFSDEASCTPLDYLIRHEQDRLCDHEVDLADTSDEEFCCPRNPDDYYCRHSQRTIPRRWCCDRDIDCEYGEDEADCVALVGSDTDTIELDRMGRPLNRLRGLVAIKSDWMSKYSDILCNYLHQGVMLNERFVSADDGDRTPVYPLGEELYTCEELQDDGRVAPGMTVKEHLMPRTLDHPLVHLNHLLNGQKLATGRAACTAVDLTCGPAAEPSCGHRPALKQLRDTPGPTSGSGVWPMYVTVYVDGAVVTGATLISPSWVMTSSEAVDLISPSSDYVAVRAGEHRRQLFATPAHQTVRVDFRSRDGDVTLLHLSRPLALGEHAYPACLPPEDGSSALRHVDYCFAVGWGGGAVQGVKLRLDPVCPEDMVCTLPAPTARCQSAGDWSGALLCRGVDLLWRAAAVFREHGPHCFGRKRRWRRLSATHLRRRLDCLNISLTAPPELGQLFRDELLDSCTPSVAIAEPPCSGHRCTLGQCIHPTKVCNGAPDCDDGSDEVDCDFNVTSCITPSGQCDCADGQIMCAESGTCRPYRAYCDGRAGCLNGADEPDICTCRGFLRLAAPELICDQNVDCITGDDEFGCRYETDRFRCYRNPEVSLIPRSEVCDVSYQCAGGEDEEHCVCLLIQLPASVPDHQGRPSFNVSETLLGSPRCDSEGFLVVRMHGRWMAVPERVWREERSRQVCAKLGYRQVEFTDMREIPGSEKSAVYISCE
ncbi:serine protease nudel-like [Pollicipes pollicipes]|uniref:serine protease nudel-like n=1 Tax=Pollicipes pollicipes TaxID=41117 RepID=UPI001884D1B4|nr:serine protease nudel-like [Pollicipes pollicipes]